MKLSALTLTVLAAAANAMPPHWGGHDGVKPPAFFLAGDSTTAIQSANGGGWGNGFLSFLRHGAWGINFGHNGATVPSFIAGGDWLNVTQHVEKHRAKFEVFVTIQFGHNDQKPEANITLDQYQKNLEHLALDVQRAGGTPLLVTPLTRRNFVSEHETDDSLHDQRLRTIAAAHATHSTYVDLNKASKDYVEAIGEDASHVYNLNPDDNTHLNDYGSVVFGRMVADLLLARKPLEPWTAPNRTLSYDIWHGLPA